MYSGVFTGGAGTYVVVSDGMYSGGGGLNTVVVGTELDDTISDGVRIASGEVCCVVAAEESSRVVVVDDTCGGSTGRSEFELFTPANTLPPTTMNITTPTATSPLFAR
ncbi:hypothetical protein RHRU231_960097 [Rhodococcus ruber]|uniref:Uncharacterized protein n=1 Tax=Rhodococcus ruber TaxID=1830 RepID=A0A098BV15_9NOCA|nr:hypothetical protein EBESD8_32360 [Rhodococcus aetherivorans]CDZ92568.1 hypothetical protein RHRU231_960097 [Rhodococcus ruber]